jgi:hypothetical protein
MGIILDISQNGLLIETVQEVESKYLSLMVSNQTGQLVEINGKVAYCRKADSGKFKTGITLEGTREENLQFVKELIRAFHYSTK